MCSEIDKSLETVLSEDEATVSQATAAERYSGGGADGLAAQA